MSDTYDPLSFMDQNGMSAEEKAALNLTTGGETPTTQAGVTTTPEEKAVLEVKQPAAQPEKFEDDGTGHTVPLIALLSEREKRQKAENELAERNRKDAEADTSEALQFELPDPAKDPAGYARMQAGIQNLNLLNERMNFSERFANMKHGEVTVKAAHDWALERFVADPAYEERIMREADPYEAIVKDHKVSQRTAQVEPDDEWQKYQEWRKTQGLPAQEAPANQQQPAVQSQEGAAPQQQAKKLPAQSIADMPGAGGGTHSVPVGAGQAFDNVFR